MTSREKDEQQKHNAHLGALYYAGLQFAASVGLTAWGGYWLDSKFSTSPLFLIVGVLFGAATGFVAVYRAAFPSQNKKPEQDS